jgi:hypothetical protein
MQHELGAALDARVVAFPTGHMGLMPVKQKWVELKTCLALQY